MKRKRLVVNILTVLFCAVFLFTGFMGVREMIRKQQAREDFEDLSNLVMQTPQATPTPQTTLLPEDEPEAVPTPEKKRNIAALQERNPHCIGWVNAPGTHIDYPVMHTPSDPQFYLRRNFDRNYSVAGTPFLDYTCTLESENLIIYGHNMNDNSMFADLHDYLDETFRKEHPIVEFETADGCTYYEVIDVRKVDMRDEWYDFGMNPGKTQYLTLSTCDNINKSNRVILIAQRIE